MAASKALETKRPPVVTRTGLIRIENAHMVTDMTPKGKVILEEFRHLYPESIANCTGWTLAKRFPQQVTVGSKATYFIPAGRLATLRGTAFALPRSIIASIRQELSSEDLRNRVHHNKTYPGRMIGAWKHAQVEEIKGIARELREHGFQASHGEFGSQPAVTLPLNYHNLAALSDSQETMPSGEGRKRLADLQKEWDRGKQMPEVPTEKAAAGFLAAIQANHGFARFFDKHGLQPTLVEKSIVLMPKPLKEE